MFGSRRSSSWKCSLQLALLIMFLQEWKLHNQLMMTPSYDNNNSSRWKIRKMNFFPYCKCHTYSLECYEQIFYYFSQSFFLHSCTHTIFLTCSNPPYLPLSLSPNSAFSHSHVSKHKNCAFINLATTTTPPPTTTTTPPTTFCNCPKELQSHIFFEPVFKVWKRLREEAGHRGRVGRL